MAKIARSNEDLLMNAVSKHKGASIADLAKNLGWVTSKGLPNKSKVHRLIGKLKHGKMMAEGRGNLTLTEKGQKAIKESQ